MPMKRFLESPAGKKRSQADWARHFGISRAYMNQLVHHGKKPSLDLALHLDKMTDGVVDVRKWPYEWPPKKVTPDGGDSSN